MKTKMWIPLNHTRKCKVAVTSQFEVCKNQLLKNQHFRTLISCGQTQNTGIKLQMSNDLRQRKRRGDEKKRKKPIEKRDWNNYMMRKGVGRRFLKRLTWRLGDIVMFSLDPTHFVLYRILETLGLPKSLRFRLID